MKYSSFKPIVQSHLWEYTSGNNENATCNDDAVIKAAPPGQYTQISSPGNVLQQAKNSEVGMMTVSEDGGRSNHLAPSLQPKQA